MTSVIIRFPDGSREFRYPANPIEEGDVVFHDGVRYRVLAIVQTDAGPPTVTVEPDSDELTDLLKSEKGAIELVLLEG